MILWCGHNFFFLIQHFFFSPDFYNGVKRVRTFAFWGALLIFINPNVPFLFPAISSHFMTHTKTKK